MSCYKCIWRDDCLTDEYCPYKNPRDESKGILKNYTQDLKERDEYYKEMIAEYSDGDCFCE